MCLPSPSVRPTWHSSARRPSESPTKANLLALYGTRCGTLTWPPMEAMFAMRPSPRRLISGRTARIVWSAALKKQCRMKMFHRGDARHGNGQGDVRPTVSRRHSSLASSGQGSCPTSHLHRIPWEGTHSRCGDLDLPTADRPVGITVNRWCPSGAVPEAAHSQSVTLVRDELRWPAVFAILALVGLLVRGEGPISSGARRRVARCRGRPSARALLGPRTRSPLRR
jgi:hypothetical protein